MDWSTIRLIFARELRDQCRDRRTLFMLLVLPLLMYPALGFGLIQLTLQFGQEKRTLGISGRENLPDSPPLLDPTATYFHQALFENPANQDLYEIVGSDDWSVDSVRSGEIDALIVVPEGFAEQLAAGEQVTISLLHNGADDTSNHAFLAAREFLTRWEEDIVAERMTQFGKPETFARPLIIERQESDISSESERSGMAWGKAFPFILVIMALTGAFYPAVDLCAGEKERGTMETLLITPARRGEIVLGKFLTILSLSVTSTVFNLISMGLTLGQVSRIIPSDKEMAAQAFAPPTIDAVLWMLVLMLPLAAFFSALCMALAIFARSTKEGQYYMMPMFLVVMPLVFLTLAPGVELDLFYSLVPVTNVALLLRAFMLNKYDLAMTYFLPVLMPTALYGYLSLRFAVDQFHREDVMFREAERFEVKLWIRKMLREKDDLPTPGQAWTLFVLILVLNWYMSFLLPPGLTTMVVSQLVVIGFLPCLFALMLTAAPLRTLSLQRPKWIPTLIGLLLVFTLHPVVLQLGAAAQEVFPIPEQLQKSIAQLIGSVSLTQKLIMFGLLPALCEEVAFRGFILRGLLRRYSTWSAILVSSVLFGVSHMISAQMVTASLLGIVLGLVLTRSGSILPCMLLHASHNCLVVYISHQSKDAAEISTASSSSFTLLVAGALASACLLGYLATLPSQYPRKTRQVV